MLSSSSLCNYIVLCIKVYIWLPVAFAHFEFIHISSPCIEKDPVNQKPKNMSRSIEKSISHPCVDAFLARFLLNKVTEAPSKQRWTMSDTLIKGVSSFSLTCNEKYMHKLNK